MFDLSQSSLFAENQFVCSASIDLIGPTLPITEIYASAISN
ncbi:MAG: hypothetical protein AAGD28_04595 [Bacteroidota bacterium]